MNRIKKGEIVGRISYNKDVIFEVTNIIKTKNNTICILKGITERIEADSPLEDLEIMDKRIVSKTIEKEEKKLLEKMKEHINLGNSKKNNNFFRFFNEEKNGIKKIYTGKILHLDGDKRYSEKSIRFYRNLRLNAIVRNIPESKQANNIIYLLNRYEPDILVITGHDGMIKKGTNFNDIYNYRNSRYFIKTVNIARRWDHPKAKNLAIFAGACQSFYEAIMSAGANFASSPARIMIDFIDPLIVAQRIATTDSKRYLTINDIEDELRDGRMGIDGVGTMGKKEVKIEL